MKKANHGQSMFELLIAVFVISMTLTAILGLVVNTISNSTFSRERTQAEKHSNEAMEWIRHERDSDWGAFRARASSSGSRYCLDSLEWDSGSCSSTEFISGTSFRREALLVINHATNPNVVEVQVVTSWVDNSGTHESRINTSLSNWRTR